MVLDIHRRVWYTMGLMKAQGQAMPHWTWVYWQGRDAWPQARDNPYPSDTKEAMAWDAGWNRAEAMDTEAQAKLKARQVITERLVKRNHE